MMSIRRGILSAGYGSYIKDGLALWMDGAEKGNTAGAWVDRANGHVFTSVNGFTNGADYVGLDGALNQYLRCSTYEGEDADTGTIEIVITDYTPRSIIFMPMRNTLLAFGLTTNGDRIICATKNVKMVNIQSGAKVFSICNNVRAIVDGANATFGSNEAWGSMDATYSYIGRRNASSSYQATAKIHAIRIYNRHLSEAEILHNQRIDNVRYKLGLSI